MKRCILIAPLLAFPTSLLGQDTLVLRADGAGVWGQGLRLAEEVRIGSLMGEADPATFGQVSGLEVMESGVIWVADRHQPTIRRFQPDGRYIDSVGRRGDGPGEFRDIMGLERLPDGRVAAWDPALARVSLYSPDGQYLDQSHARGGVIVYGRPIFRADASGRLWILGGVEHPGEEGGDRWFRYNPDGELVDSVISTPADLEGPKYARQRYGSNEMYGFATRTFSTPSPMGYLVEARNEDLTLTLRKENGPIVRIGRNWEPIVVETGERNTFQRLEDLFAARRGEAPGRVPRVKPPFWDLWVDQDGRIWAARHGDGVRVPETESERETREGFGNPPKEWWETLVFDVIAPSGEFLGTIRFPNRQTDLAAARGSHVWTIERGEYGENYVVRYRITSNAGLGG